ncbi:unnamed protein product, partial [Rotaria sp. Silwood1]
CEESSLLRIREHSTIRLVKCS